MKLENIINVIRNVKLICKEYVVLIEIGAFYYCYGKDALILGYIGKYKINIVKDNIYSCSFPKVAYNKVISKLENSKVNYIILDRRNNYSEQEKSNNKNLNNYNKYYETSKNEFALQIRIEKINKYLLEHKEDKELLTKVERLINERRKIQSN